MLLVGIVWQLSFFACDVAAAVDPDRKWLGCTDVKPRKAPIRAFGKLDRYCFAFVTRVSALEGLRALAGLIDVQAAGQRVDVIAEL